MAEKVSRSICQIKVAVEELKGSQRKYLRGLAHGLKPVVIIGQKGLTDAVVASVDEALDTHELIKLKFVEYKEKEDKKEISAAIEKACSCQMVGMIGHISIFYRMHSDPEKRKIVVPGIKE